MQASKTDLIRVEQVSLVPQLFQTKSTPAATNSLVAEAYLLRDISFQVARGDRIAIVGASGSGKTTLLRLLNRLSEPTGGVIYFNNQPIRQIPVVQLRQQVALVLQESKLLGMTVRQALEYPLVLRRLPQQTIQQRVQSWTEQLHIPNDWFPRTELQLSIGQRQLVAIARALVSHPQVLLLDEPTSALDVGRAHLVLNVLSELAQSGELTVLMANHQLELAEQFCDRVLYLHQGVLQHDLPVRQMDWQQLQQKLVQAEVEQQQEWD